MSKSKQVVNNTHKNSNKIDKTLVLNRIKSHFNFKYDAELARFLGIGTNTIANWYTRNTLNFDLILHKCADLNPNWLLYGIGRATISYHNLDENVPSIVEEKDEYKTSSQLREIERLNQIIEAQQLTIAAQGKTIEMMEELLNKK